MWSACAVATAFVFAASSAAARGAGAAGAADLVGVAHVDGKYFLNPREDFLNEGADRVLELGSRTIKVYLESRRYPWNSQWPKGVRSLEGMARTPYFRKLFAKPFHTFILTAYSVGLSDDYWTRGVTEVQLAEETRQFHDLTKYLLSEYRGTGKVFVLQQWEGDWALRSGDHVHTFDPKFEPPAEAVEGMVRWINARQAGVVAARAEVESDVRVYGALEANRVGDSIKGMRGVANSVLPRTRVDLASYSSYEFNSWPKELGEAVDFLVAHLPETAVFGRSARSVYLGEYGYPEHGEGGAAEVELRIDTVLGMARERRMPWAVYWQVYCNEPVAGAPAPPLNGAPNVQNVRGFWLIRPDGTRGAAWDRLRRVITAKPE